MPQTFNHKSRDKRLRRQETEMDAKRKRILAVSIAILILAVSLIVVFSQSLASNNNDANSPDLARVACMGDSITNITGYPADLQALLGSGSKVGNFGYDGAAVNLQSDRTYYGSEQFRNARVSQPTTIVIMLGTNDARTNLNGQSANFVHDYELMINSIISGIHPFAGQPKIYLVLPPPVFQNNINLTSSIFTEQIIPKIRQVASDLGLPLIDVYTPLLNHSEDFSDGVHPNAEGAQIIADTIYQALKS
jgi:lysophospholipase L1-like esterase